MSTYTGVTNFQKTVRFFWPTLYITVFVYTFHQEPTMQAVFPKFGPRSGGTQLSVHGQNLNIGSRLMVYASSQLCTVIRYQPTEFCSFIICYWGWIKLFSSKFVDCFISCSKLVCQTVFCSLIFALCIQRGWRWWFLEDCWLNIRKNVTSVIQCNTITNRMQGVLKCWRLASLVYHTSKL